MTRRVRAHTAPTGNSLYVSQQLTGRQVNIGQSASNAGPRGRRSAHAVYPDGNGWAQWCTGRPAYRQLFGTRAQVTCQPCRTLLLHDAPQPMGRPAPAPTPVRPTAPAGALAPAVAPEDDRCGLCVHDRWAHAVRHGRMVLAVDVLCNACDCPAYERRR